MGQMESVLSLRTISPRCKSSDGVLPLAQRWHDLRYSLLQCRQNSVFSRWMRFHRVSPGRDEVVSTGSGGDLNGRPIRKWTGVKTVEPSAGVESAGRRGRLFIVALIPTRIVESSSKYRWWGPTILLRRVFMDLTPASQSTLKWGALLELPVNLMLRREVMKQSLCVWSLEQVLHFLYSHSTHHGSSCCCQNIQ